MNYRRLEDDGFRVKLRSNLPAWRPEADSRPETKCPMMHDHRDVSIVALSRT